MSTNNIEFRDTSKLSDWIVLTAKILIIGYILATLFYFPAFDNWYYNTESLILNFFIVVTSLLGMVSTIAVIILLLRWIYLSNMNSKLMGAKNMQFSPGWAVGWNFVPIMNLFMPFRVMKEIWKTSKDPENWESLETPSIIIWWWPITLISNGVTNYSLRAEYSWGYDTTQLQNLAMVDLFFTIVWCILTINLVKEISQMQNQDR